MNNVCMVKSVATLRSYHVVPLMQGHLSLLLQHYSILIILKEKKPGWSSSGIPADR